MSETPEERKKRKREERKKRREARKLERMRRKAEELKAKMEERQQAEKEEYEPAAIKEKGYEFPGELVCLGKGTFADVFQMKKSNQDIAAKVIELERSDNYNEKFLSRALIIIPLLDSKHKNIIAIQDIFKTSKRVFIMMECASKGSIFDYVNDNGAIDEQQAKKWIVDICKGINFLHTNEVAHRNIRTENLLLDSNLNVKISGFSFSRLCIDPANSKPVYSATSCGAQPYYAPEILKGERYDPKATDAWSTGVVLFVVTNKRYPFDYRDYTIQMQQQQDHGWKRPEKLKAKLSEPFVDLLTKIFECNFKARIRIRQILDHPSLSDVDGNSKKERDESASIKDQLCKAFSATAPTDSSMNYMSAI